jgi:hypothetical protein
MNLDPAWIGAVVAVVGAVVDVKPLRWAWRLLSGTHDLVADWAGKPEHNGVAATPGVMARLAEHEKLLGKLIAETEPNGGNSLRDVVARTAADVAGIKDEQARLREQIEKGTR